MDYSKFPLTLKVNGTTNRIYLDTQYDTSLVYTDEKIVESMLDLLPGELWANPNLKFLDPCCKSGIFLERIFWRLEEGLKEQIPDFIDRSDHILTKQLYGFALNGKLADISRSVLYGTTKANHIRAYTRQFSTEEGNIKNLVKVYNGHVFTYVNIMKEETGDFFKNMIKEAFGDMQFDVVIGNPPYQEMDGGGDSLESSLPIYNKFIDRAIQIEPKYILMVIPSRWACGGKAVLDDFRKRMIESNHLQEIHNFRNSKDVFGSVNINGGVQYFLYNNEYNSNITTIINKELAPNGIVGERSSRDLSDFKHTDSRGKEQYMIILDNKAYKIISKIISTEKNYLSETVLQCTPFGIKSNFSDSVRCSVDKGIKVIKSSGRISYTDIKKVTQNVDIVGRYKTIIGRITNYHGEKVSMIVSTPRVIGVNEVCTTTYLVIGSFYKEEQAINLCNYIKTKFARFLIYATISGMNMTSKNFMFVPIQDFTKTWTDEELYKKYSLTQEEIDIIETTIKEMD